MAIAEAIHIVIRVVRPANIKGHKLGCGLSDKGITKFGVRPNRLLMPVRSTRPLRSDSKIIKARRLVKCSIS